MSWIAVPPISTPNLPPGVSAGGVDSFDQRLVGVQAPDAKYFPTASEQPFSDDFGKVVFFNSTTQKWIMATVQTFGNSYGAAKFGIVADGNFLAIQTTEINGYAWFSDGSRKVYLSIGYGWVYVTALAAGVEPREWYDADLEVWQGDAFWAGETISASLAPRGVYKDDGVTTAITTADYEPDYERWESGTQYGEYTGAGGATGTRAVGNATWKEGSAWTWIQRSDYSDGTKAKDLHRSSSFFGGSELTLTWNATASAYVAGTFGSELGWWQNTSAPVAGVAYTISFTVPSGSAVTGTDIELTPSAYVAGDWIPTKAAIYALDWAVMV